MKYKSKLEKDLAVAFKHEVRKYKTEYCIYPFMTYPKIAAQLRINGDLLIKDLSGFIDFVKSKLDQVSNLKELNQLEQKCIAKIIKFRNFK